MGSTAWPATNASAGATAAGASQYQSPAPGYQPASYPSTAYGQARITPASGASASQWGATVPAANNNGVTATGYTSGGITTSGAGLSAANTSSPGGYGGTSPVASTNPTTASGSTISGVQPQSGYYNPAYEGGTANQYASGGTIPGMAPSTVPAAANPAGTSSPNYYTADARNSMAGGAAGGANMSSYNGAATGYANPTTSTGNASAYQPANNYQTSPSGYTPGNTGYQPGVNSNPPGNTGYNPTDVYSNPSSAAGSGAATMPARAENEYRPGGTSNYVPTSGNALQPAGGTGPQENRATASGVMPASYQTPVSSTSSASEVYRAYQGSTANKEPAYGASNPNSAAAATSQTRTW